jgi:acyl dehydratase
MAGCYDFGAQRISWVAHVLSDWFGDDGFLTGMEVRVRRPNFVGDTTWLSGQVVGVEPDADGESVLASVSVLGVNQKGEETTVATATVRLPE